MPDDLNDLIGALGGAPQSNGDPNTPPADTGTEPPANNQDPQTPPPGQGENPPPADNSNPQGTEPSANGGDPAGQQTQTPPPQEPSKAAAAFAQMRTQNKQYEELLKGIAGLVGLENVNDPTQISTALQQKIVEAQAQKQGVPAELIQRLNTLEQANQQHTREQVQQAAYLGFQKVKDEFKLDDKGLQTFADELVANGVNPFEQPVDLVSEYKIRNFEKLIQAAVERGIQQEQQRAASAQQHGTTPNGQTGNKPGETGSITTVAELNKFFASQEASK
jgi:hypothetical protein